MKGCWTQVIIAIALVTSVCAGDQISSPVTGKLFERALALVPPAASTSQKLQVVAGDKIIAIGDSITAEGSYLHYVEQVLAASDPSLSNFRIINSGVSGQKAENLIIRFQRDVIARQPTIVMINVGINDVWHRLQEPHLLAVFEAYRENITKMVEMAQAAGIRVLLLAPTIIQEDLNAPGNLRLPVYAHAMREIAESKQCQFIDLHAMFLSALRHRPPKSQPRWLTVDGVHMSPLGSAMMALGVLRALGVPDQTIAGAEITITTK